MNNLFASV